MKKGVPIESVICCTQSWSKNKLSTFILYRYFHWMQDFLGCGFFFFLLAIWYIFTFFCLYSFWEKSPYLLCVCCLFSLKNFFKDFLFITSFSNFTVIWLVVLVIFISFHAWLWVFISLGFIGILSLYIIFFP